MLTAFQLCLCMYNLLTVEDGRKRKCVRGAWWKCRSTGLPMGRWWCFSSDRGLFPFPWSSKHVFRGQKRFTASPSVGVVPMIRIMSLCRCIARVLTNRRCASEGGEPRRSPIFDSDDNDSDLSSPASPAASSQRPVSCWVDIRNPPPPLVFLVFPLFLLFPFPGPSSPLLSYGCQLDQTLDGKQPPRSCEECCRPVCMQSASTLHGSLTDSGEHRLGIELTKIMVLQYSNQETSVTIGESVRDEDGMTSD